MVLLATCRWILDMDDKQTLFRSHKLGSVSTWKEQTVKKITVDAVGEAA